MPESTLDEMAADLRKQAAAVNRTDYPRSVALLSAAAKASKLARALTEARVSLDDYLPAPAIDETAAMRSRLAELDARYAAAVEAATRAEMPADAGRVQSFRNRQNGRQKARDTRGTVTQETARHAETALVRTIETDPRFADLRGELDEAYELRAQLDRVATTDGRTNDEFPF